MLQTYTQNKQYLLLFRGNTGYRNVPQIWVYTYSSCLILMKYTYVLCKVRNESLKVLQIHFNCLVNSETN